MKNFYPVTWKKLYSIFQIFWQKTKLKENHSKQKVFEWAGCAKFFCLWEIIQDQDPKQKKMLWFFKTKNKMQIFEFKNSSQGKRIEGEREREREREREFPLFQYQD